MWPCKADDGFVLADYFDDIGGSGTGAIIAAGFALGLKVTLLMLVMHNATTQGPLTLFNNPTAKYNDLSRMDANAR